MKHAWSHPNLLFGSFFHDNANGEPPTASTSPACISTPAESISQDSILQSICRRIRNGAIQIARQFCEYRSAQVSADMARALLKPEDPARLPRIFFVSLSWAAPPFDLERKSAVLSPSSTGDRAMEYRDHEMVIIKRHAKPSSVTVNASQISSAPVSQQSSPSIWSTSFLSSSKTQSTTVSDFEYELVQGYIADGADASLSNQTSPIQSANATSPHLGCVVDERREFGGMDSERWRASGHALATPFGSVRMAEFLASVRRHAGIRDALSTFSSENVASVDSSSSGIGRGGNQGGIQCGGDNDNADGRSPSSSDAASNAVGDTDGGVRFCSQRHRRWLGASHERALDGRRGCWTGVSIRELRDEHIEFGLHYAPTEAAPYTDQRGVIGGGDLKSHRQGDNRLDAVGVMDADNIADEDKVHAEDEAATPVAWRLRAFRERHQKSRVDSVLQSVGSI